MFSSQNPLLPPPSLEKDSTMMTQLQPEKGKKSKLKPLLKMKNLKQNALILIKIPKIKPM